ncbi:MAG: hypothetical protein QOG02_1518 [Gaiellales bacterium]|nr:hypothetical protein [Gaiellales bacterium]
MMCELTELRGMTVVVGDHPIGRVSDLILDRLGETALGFDVRAHSGRHYFLPLALSRMANGSLAAASPLHLVEDVDDYRRRGLSVSWPAAGAARVELLTGRILPGGDPAGSSA